MSVERKIFGCNLRKARLAKGYTLEGLGSICKASALYISAVELRKINVSIHRMSAFAKAFGVTLCELLHSRFALDNSAKQNRR